MSLVVFISSTVRDFAVVREEIAERLRQRRGVEVRMSEEADFPVQPGMTSHDACLAAVDGVDVFLLLVGFRFGGKYPGTDKSITWCEYDQAFDRGAIIIPLILGEANDLAERAFKRRAAIARDQGLAAPLEQDAALQKEPEFADRKPIIDDFPAVQRFIDALRKGHADNWIHRWKGTADDAMKVIDSRLNAALMAHHRDHAGSRDLAKRAMETFPALIEVMGLAGLSAIERRGEGLSGDDACARILEQCAERRGQLLGYREGDLYNLMLYRREGDSLMPGPRVTHPAMKRRNRVWKVGEGHVGLAVKTNQPLVTGDLPHTTAWKPLPDSGESDAALYVSAISVPLFVSGNTQRADGAFIVTSSRRNHFRDPKQVEVLTAEALGRILSMVWL